MSRNSTQSFTKGDDGKWPPLRHKNKQPAKNQTEPGTSFIATIQVEFVVENEDLIIQTRRGPLAVSAEAIARRIVRTFMKRGRRGSLEIVDTKIIDIRPK